ncbi:odorant receptor 46a isoform X1 [Microplitis demolitor]|uniref:odorant receptor 46a isoform X1 n=1 Tax=Microplitis demolitor TaxID=69319 RepID=UPI0006D4D862|nr:odorant receptor 46a isoform X1 [Microplitis demolitor]
MSANVDIAYDTLFPGMMMQVCAQINVLKHRFRLTLDALENVSVDKMDPVMVKTVEKKIFAECVEYHVEILRMVDIMSHVFGPMIFIQYSFSSIILCSSVYALSQMVPFSPEFIACSVYILCMFFQIFVICMSGNRVTLEFAELSTAMYNTNWFALSNNAQKHIVMMMMSSIKPIIFASGHVVTLSLESFKRFADLSNSTYNTDWCDLDIRHRKSIIIIVSQALKPVIFTSGYFVTLSLELFKNVIKLSYSIYNFLQ